MKTVYQTDEQGVFVGPTVAPDDPLDGGWLIPRGAVETPPPTPGVGEQARWDGSNWVVETVPPEANTTPVPEPEPVHLRKLVIVDRLDAVGLLDAAIAAFDSNPRMKMRWDAAVEINPDDPNVRGFITGIGGDPDSILATS